MSKSIVLMSPFLFLVIIGADLYAQNQDLSRSIRLSLNSPANARSSQIVRSQDATEESLQALPPPAQSLRVVDDSVIASGLPRQRDPQLSPDHLIVVAYNRNGRELARTAMLDPRLIRAETIDDQGQMSSKKFYRDRVEFSVGLPNDPNIFQLKIYNVRWDGTGYLLDLLGETQITN